MSNRSALYPHLIYFTDLISHSTQLTLVGYYINMEHKCIDVLDSNDHKQKCTDSDDHHVVVSKKIVTCLNEALQAMTGGKFPVFADWRRPLFNTLKQVLENDYTFFTMKFMEFYDDEG